MKKVLLCLILLVLISSCSYINKKDEENKTIEINYNLEEFNNKFYYNQLNETSKKYYYLIYDASLRYYNCIQYDFEYVDIDFSKALNAFTHDWPIYYWWSNGVETIFNDGVYTTTARDFDQQEVIDNCAKIERISKEILENTVNDYMVDTLRNIHDYLINLIDYDNSSSNSHNIVGALIDNKCACDGYADSFQYLANLAGFNCYSIVGNAINSQGINTHAWNCVQIEDKWYVVDVTWDDPVSNEEINMDISYEYFLASNDIMNVDHYPDDNYVYDDCYDETYYFYEKPGMFSKDGDKQEIKNFLIYWLKQGKDLFMIKFKYNSDAKTIAEWLIDDEGFADIFVENYNSEQSFSYGYQYVATSQILYIQYNY